MTDNNERVTSLKRKYRRQHNLDKARAIWGDIDGTVADPNRPGKVLIMTVASNGLFTRRSVWAPTNPFAYRPGDPIRLKYDDGRLKVDEPDHAAMLSQGVNPLARSQQQNSERTTQTNLATLAVVADLSQPILGFRIKAWNPIVNKIAYQFPGIRTYEELGAFTPPSTDEMYYVAVFVKNDYATLEVFYSTPRGVTDIPLGLADIQECLNQASSGSTFVWAQKLIGDQATITQADLDNDGVPMQQLVNTSEFAITGTATLITGTVVVSTTAVTASSRIFLTPQETGLFTGSLRVSARVAGTSFTILSTVLTDTASVAWMIIES